MTAKDSKALNRAVPIGAFSSCSPPAFVYSWAADKRVLLREARCDSHHRWRDNGNLIMPLFINSCMPDLFVIIFMLVLLLAAAMYHLSAIFHTMEPLQVSTWSHISV